MSLKAWPMSIVCPLEEIAVKVIGTPVAFVGSGLCMCRYSIHALMLASDMAGVLGCAGDKSMTVPVISTLDPFVVISGEVETVVAVVPLSNPYIIGM